MNIKLITVLVLLLSGCGGSDPAVASKSLFSSWTADDNSLVLNLSGGGIGMTTIIYLTHSTGEVCSCTSTYSGSEASFSALVGLCSYLSGGGGDPGCNAYNGTYTGTNTNAKLNFCLGASCSSYH